MRDMNPIYSTFLFIFGLFLIPLLFIAKALQDYFISVINGTKFNWRNI